MKTPSEGPTVKVRNYVRERYVRPARREKRATFRVQVGEVHHALRFANRVPLVCNALSSKKFLEENCLRLIRRTGPPSGLSTTVEFTYQLLDGPVEQHPLDDLLKLRGAFKKIFDELGGGENYLRTERSEFYHQDDRGRNR